MKTVGFRKVITFIVGIIIATFILGYALNIKATAKESYFSEATDDMEISFRREVKDIMKSIGAANAGITMTKICEDGHHLSYEVKINLPDYIKDAEIAKAYEELSQLELDIDDSSVTFLFTGKEE